MLTLVTRYPFTLNSFRKQLFDQSVLEVVEPPAYGLEPAVDRSVSDAAHDLRFEDVLDLLLDVENGEVFLREWRFPVLLSAFGFFFD